jgi:hypothetical protein
MGMSSPFGLGESAGCGRFGAVEIRHTEIAHYPKDEVVPMAPPGTDGPVRVPGVDRGSALEAQQVCWDGRD